MKILFDERRTISSFHPFLDDAYQLQLYKIVRDVLMKEIWRKSENENWEAPIGGSKIISNQSFKVFQSSYICCYWLRICYPHYQGTWYIM